MFIEEISNFFFCQDLFDHALDDKVLAFYQFYDFLNLAVHKSKSIVPFPETG